MKLVRFLGFVAAGLFSLLMISSPASRGQAKPAAPASGGPVNLYQDVVSHQGAITLDNGIGSHGSRRRLQNFQILFERRGKSFCDARHDH